MQVDVILSWFMLDLDIFHASWCDFDLIHDELGHFSCKLMWFWADTWWTWSFFMLVRWFWVWHRDCDRNFRDFHIWYRSIAEIAMIILIPYVKKWILDIELTKIWAICDGNAQKHGWVSMKLSDFRWNCDEFEWVGMNFEWISMECPQNLRVDMKFHDFDIWYHSKAGIARIILIPHVKNTIFETSQGRGAARGAAIKILGVGVGGGVGVGVLPFEVNNK